MIIINLQKSTTVTTLFVLFITLRPTLMDNVRYHQIIGFISSSIQKFILVLRFLHLAVYQQERL